MKQRTWRRVVIELLIGGVLIFFMLRWFEHSQVYHPSRSMYATGAELGRPFEDVGFRASDGIDLHGWFYPVETNSARSNLVVMVCHGNGGNISHRLEMVQAMLSTGLNVFVFDYRGYGRSRGRPSEEGTYLDAQAAQQWLQRKGFRSEDILLYGESLGGGVAAEVALRGSAGGLILQSTFTSIPDIGAELFPWLPVRSIARIRYDTYSKLPRLKIPLLVMHSRVDGLIHFRHSEKNFAVANDPKIFCEIGGGHNDPLASLQAYLDGIEKFLCLLQTNRVMKDGVGTL